MASGRFSIISPDKWRLPTAESAKAWGRLLASCLRPQAAVFLNGELGAGKTTVAQGILAGLGVREVVNSPTFDLVHRYPLASLTVYHVDLYRLSDPSEVWALDLPPADPGVVLVVEWGKTLAWAYPERLECTLTRGEHDQRWIQVEAVGAGMAHRWRRWRETADGI
jgi:tRNA threonylcarbamoyladenosine biosynthesis protein TsaE